MEKSLENTGIRMPGYFISGPEVGFRTDSTATE